MSAAAPIRRLGGVTYDPVRRSFRGPRGRYVSEAQTLAVFEGQIEATGKRMRALAENLRAGRSTLAEFQLAMMDEAKSLHVLSAAVEAGGFRQLSRSDLGFVGSLVKEQFRFIARMAREIESGKQALDGTLLSRVDQHAKSARATRDRMMGRIMEARGYDLEQWFLSPADHCRDRGSRMGCVERAAMGRGPIGSRPGYSQCSCYNNCRCKRRLYRSAEAA